jgi:ribonuclease D
MQIGSFVQKHYIEDSAALVSLCEQLAQADVLAIDTEFVRTRTLYPRLGLLQICDGQHLALIDPIAIDDLSPFWQLLNDGNISKVLHACSEDLEVFLTAANCKPVNLIDSQIMMSFLKHGLSMGYAAMVEHYTGIALDKSESRTDWTKRPLTERQRTYAAADVDYLFQIYPQILAELKQSGWLEAAQLETQRLIDRKFTPIDESQLYRNVKLNWRLNPEQLNLLQHLAIWRYQKAKQKDMPIGFIVKDNTLLAVAQRNPLNLAEMSKLAGAEMLDVRHQGKAMLSVLKQAAAVSVQQYPKKLVRLDEYPGYKQTFKKVKAFIVDAAERSEQTVDNFASKKQINQFLSWHYKINDAEHQVEAVDILQGWRLSLFGEQLTAFASNDFTGE